MVRIRYRSSRVPLSPRILRLLIILLLFLPWETILPQQAARRRVEIIWSDNFENDFVEGRSRQKLSGHVNLKHNDMYMNCDSAWYFDQTNEVFAFSNIHIHQGDTIHIYGSHLKYNGDTGKAVITDSVEMVDKETHLYTDKIDYDVNTQVAVYNDGGRILNGENTLTSRIGIYYSNKKMMHFRDSVKIVNPEYVMRADTMRYDTYNEVVWFTGPTEAVGDSIYLYCESGWSDTRNDVSQLMKNAVLDNLEQQITGDTLWYDEKTSFGEAFGNVTITDTTDNVVAGGNYAWYYKNPERFLITDNAYFSMFSDDDTITLRADTLRAIPQADTAGINHRLLTAAYQCTIFSREMQGKCDSLAYSFRDSVIRLYTDPIIWTQENQLTSDSVALFTKNRKADYMELYNKAFVISSVDSIRYNQIKGRKLTGYFRDNKLYHIVVVGNSESIYYVLDGDALVGVSKAKSAVIEIFIDQGKLKEIYEKQSPEGTLDPPLKTPDEDIRLEGFIWLPGLRPQRSIHGPDETLLNRLSRNQRIEDIGSQTVTPEEKEKETEIKDQQIPTEETGYQEE